MKVMTIIKRSNTAKELIHNISLAEVQEQGKTARFLIEHEAVKQERKRIGLSEKAKQRELALREQAWQDVWKEDIGNSIGLDDWLNQQLNEEDE